ncbi:MAG: OmpA family protein [Solirubrobacterales bacterium]
MVKATWRGAALAALMASVALPAAAQMVIGGESRPSVEVNYSVLDRLGPEPTLADRLKGQMPRSGAQVAPAGRAAASGLAFHPYKPEKAVRKHSEASPSHRTKSAAAKPAAAKVVHAPKPAAVIEAKAEAPKPAAVAPKAEKAPAVPPKAEVAAMPEPVKPAAGPQVALPEVAKPAPVEVAKVEAPKAEPAKPEPTKPEPTKPEPAPAAAAPAPQPVAAAPMPLAPTAAPAPTPVQASPAALTPPSVAPAAPAPAAPAPAAPAQVASLAAPAAPAVTSRGDTMSILFTGDSPKLPDSAAADLRKLAARMEKDEALALQLMAYADGDEANVSKARRLSLTRALEVRKYLMEQGVRSTRIEVRALGNKSEGGPADRVDAVVVGR